MSEAVALGGGTPEEQAVRLFHSVRSSPPDGVWTAPGRVNLIGEHTDYNDGFVLPLAIHLHAAVAAATRDDRRIRVTTGLGGETVCVTLDDLTESVDWDALDVPTWARYALGAAWALLWADRDGLPPRPDLPGVEIAIASNVPIGAGLSSSTAIETAVAVALVDLWQLSIGRTDIARACQRAENEAVGAPTGIMDQLASVYGVADSAVMIDCRSLDVTPVPLGFAAAGLQLFAVDTNVQHAHSEGGYRARYESCTRAARVLGVAALRDIKPGDLPRVEAMLDVETAARVRHVVTENQRVLAMRDHLVAGRVRELGPLMQASHRSMRDDFEISTPELDTGVEAALAAGALGARMTGGGFGGSAIVLVESHRAADVLAGVRSAFTDFSFALPTCHFIAASGAAGRARLA